MNKVTVNLGSGLHFDIDLWKLNPDLSCSAVSTLIEYLQKKFNLPKDYSFLELNGWWDVTKWLDPVDYFDRSLSHKNYELSFMGMGGIYSFNSTTYYLSYKYPRCDGGVSSKEWLVVFGCNDNNISHNIQEFFDYNIERYSKYIEEISRETKNRNANALSRLFLDDTLKKDIVNDVETFINSKELYKDTLGLDWKRGIILYGPPGNGKSLMIKSLASHFGLQKLDLARCINPRGELSLAKETCPASRSYSTDLSEMMHVAYPKKELPTIIYIEDLDKFVANKDLDIPKVSVSSLLKAMDGVDNQSGVLFIATTNFMNELVEGLIARPGRFDRIYSIPRPEKLQIRQMLDYYAITCSDGNIDDIVERLHGLSMAFVEEFVKSAITSYRKKEIAINEALTIIERLIDHNSKYGKSQSDLGFN